MKKRKSIYKEDYKIKNNIHITKKTISSNYALHWHDFFEMELIIDGHGTQILNGQEIELKKGTVYLLSPNDFHEITCNEYLSLFHIQFSADMVGEEMLKQFSSPESCYACTLSDTNYKELLYLIEALYVGETKDASFKRNILSCIFTIITNNATTNPCSLTSALTNNMVSKAKLYMAINFKSNPSLDDIANYLGLNRSYFSRLFYKETKQTPMSYLASLKLAYAKTLLVSTTLSVTEIGFICGYGSFSNFSKAFKAYFHISPTEMRKDS